MPHKIRNEQNSKLNGSDTQSNAADTKNGIADLALFTKIKSGPRIIGRKEYLKHLQNKKITRDEAIAAQCYACMGYYRDGREDCKIYTCPLYPFSPSRLYSRPEPLKTKEDRREVK